MTFIKTDWSAFKSLKHISSIEQFILSILILYHLVLVCHLDYHSLHPGNLTRFMIENQKLNKKILVVLMYRARCKQNTVGVILNSKSIWFMPGKWTCKGLIDRTIGNYVKRKRNTKCKQKRCKPKDERGEQRQVGTCTNSNYGPFANQFDNHVDCVSSRLFYFVRQHCADGWFGTRIKKQKPNQIEW